MRTLPTAMIRVLAPFAPLFSKRVWQNVQVLLAGAILAPGRRTVASALRAMGLDREKRFHRYHRVLRRASWASLKASRILVGLLVETLVPEGDPLVLDIDETLERRYGKKIRAKGVYRDPVRSTHRNFVKSSGLRWVLTEWAWQLLLLVRHWYPEREIVAVADGAYASLKLLSRCRKLSNPIIFITRLRLDAALYEPAPPRRPGQIGRPRLKGERLPNLSVVAKDPATVWKPIAIANWYGGGERMVEIASETAVWYSTGLFAVPVRWVLVRDPQREFKTQALLCTDLEADPQKIVSWFVLRWQLEVTFQEVRRHLGFETQRQWSQMGIQRTTPALLGVFSLVALIAHQQMRTRALGALREVAWYHKRHPTFTDALALVRKELWAQEETFCESSQKTEMVKVPRAFVERLTDAVCYAA